MNTIEVGVRSDGQIVISAKVNGQRVTLDMNLPIAEWLRDRLFHVCAKESALREPTSEGGDS